jgi:DNA-3-methyladenine glycosylase
MANKIKEEFYVRPNVAQLARELLGKALFTEVNNVVTGGIIVETEAYSHTEKGCHAFKGQTPRNSVMFNRGGVAYVYLVYGMHHMFNVVTNYKNEAEAVLIRALAPVVGIETMMERVKAKSSARVTSGPGKLCKALAIDRQFNGLSLLGNRVWLEDIGNTISDQVVMSAPRIGIDYAGDDALLPWRFYLNDSPWVSKR